MNPYLQLLKDITDYGTVKPAARENMPGTKSLFGYQFRHDLRDGFPLLTTKEIYWKGVVVELLWFLRGDTNVKYLIDHGVNIWNEDAYNYYVKLASGNDERWNPVMRDNGNDTLSMFTYEEFIDILKTIDRDSLPKTKGYVLGDCGYQYGKVWRKWEQQVITENGKGVKIDEEGNTSPGSNFRMYLKVDQIANVIKSLKENPASRRHIVTAVDPAHENDLALYWCHSMFQFNCRPRNEAAIGHDVTELAKQGIAVEDMNVPLYFLDCHLYQRSADSFLGVPFNIASYALLTHIIAKICNMIPGDYIHTFGDVHIYDNHTEAVAEQLSRTPGPLPELVINDNIDIDNLSLEDFELSNYEPQSKIKAELSTGMVK